MDVFDFMLLGYRVDWPIKIIVTPAALQIYAEIFHHLIQVKLATSSLAGVWYHLKVLFCNEISSHRFDKLFLDEQNYLEKRIVHTL